MKQLRQKAGGVFATCKTIAVIAIASFSMAIGAAVNAAPTFPSEKAISLIVPYPAGGPSDNSARTFSGEIDKAIGQKVIVENIGGATGSIAANKMLSMPADGYQIFHGSPNELILPSFVNKSIKFKPEDFELVQPITTATIVLLTRNGLEVSTLDDFIRLAQNKDRAPLTYASVGTGSLYHLIGERLSKELGLNIQHVPYRGSTPALTDLAGGQIDFAILAFQVLMVHQQEQGRYKILSALGSEVPEPLKNVPLITASKLIKDMDYRIAGGYFVKKGTPAEAKNQLRKAVGAALQNPAVREKLETEGRIVAEPMSADEAQTYWNNEISNIRKLVEMVDYQPL